MAAVAVGQGVNMAAIGRWSVRARRSRRRGTGTRRRGNGGAVAWGIERRARRGRLRSGRGPRWRGARRNVWFDDLRALRAVWLDDGGPLDLARRALGLDRDWTALGGTRWRWTSGRA